LPISQIITSDEVEFIVQTINQWKIN